MVRNFSHDQTLLLPRSTHITIPNLLSPFSHPSALMLNMHLVCSILALNSGNEGYFRSTQRQFSENISSEDDLRSRIFGTFIVKFLACMPLLGFSNI